MGSTLSSSGSGSSGLGTVFIEQKYSLNMLAFLAGSWTGVPSFSKAAELLSSLGL